MPKSQSHLHWVVQLWRQLQLVITTAVIAIDCHLKYLIEVPVNNLCMFLGHFRVGLSQKSIFYH